MKRLVIDIRAGSVEEVEMQGDELVAFEAERAADLARDAKPAEERLQLQQQEVDAQ